MIEIREYVDTQERSPYARWFDRLNAQAAAKVATALISMEMGNLSNVKSVGGGSMNVVWISAPDTGSISGGTGIH